MELSKVFNCKDQTITFSLKKSHKTFRVINVNSYDHNRVNFHSIIIYPSTILNNKENFNYFQPLRQLIENVIF